jgi:superoxide dismutase, Cu-Zn family
MVWVMKMYATTVLIALLGLAGCDDTKEPSATADLKPLGDSGVTGKATFTTHGTKVQVDAEISGLTPGKHGFHVHEFGDCSAPDGTSAGGHFNPEGHPHGAPGPASHPGDLGNLEADANGRATLSLELESFTVDAAKLGVVGRGLIVHEKADDLVSQPVGEAGGRLACAVITADSGATTPVLKPAT